MSSEFDFIQNADYHNGNPIHLSCHNGCVYVFEQIASRPRSVTLKNIDNLDGEDPDPDLVTLEDLPARVRGELRKRDIRYRQEKGVSLAGVMHSD